MLRITETVEPEFDAEERDSWYALVEFETATCPKCGQLRVICSDPERTWFPQRHVCYASADLEANQRRWHAKHEKAKPMEWRMPTDGTTLWVSTEDLSPDDDFL